MQIAVDIEPTNRCNAKCHFCPRDQTPHQGLMTPEVFDRALHRVIEFRDVAHDVLGAEVVVNLCGLGEPLLNKNTPEFVRKVRDAGFSGGLSSNAALLNDARGRALLDAGLQKIHINVGTKDDDYDEVYKLPFEKTRDNVVHFAEMAGDDCEVQIVLVDFKRDREHLREMVGYWKERGLDDFAFFDIMNRGGALFVDHMQYESFPEQADARDLFADRGLENPVCPAPFAYQFIGYDGQYYLCCSDWKKEVPFGSVFDVSLIEITGQKLEHVVTRNPICKTCNHDPLNMLTDELRAMSAGQSEYSDAASVADEVSKDQGDIIAAIRKLQAAGDEASSRAGRTLIPVTST